jgi:DNA polymerase-3 subunit alpha
MEKEVIGIYVSDHPLRGHERTITQNSTHSCASIAEQDEQVFVKIAGVIAKMRVIVTKSEGKRMASIVLEDFSGQATCVAFPATFEKLKDVLLKDTVVQITGYVMHREMRGEKSIELRIEDVKKLEPELDLGTGTGGNSRGIVTLVVPRATKTQFMKLRQIIEDNPGDYEVLLQFPADGNCHQVYLTHHVKPDDIFKRAVQDCLYRCDIDILDHNNLGMAA